MALSSEEIVNKSFASVRRGYDPDEVRSFLKQIANERVPALGRQEAGSHSDVDEAAEDVRALLIAAREAAAKLKESSERDAQAVADKATDEVHDLKHNATQEATATLEEAKRRAEQLVEEAKRYADEQRTAAERDRKELLDEATRHHEQLMAEKAQLQDSAARAEKALANLQSALTSGHGPAPRDAPQPPSVIELDPSEKRAGQAG
jgi:DivIVA domain-containing protein